VLRSKRPLNWFTLKRSRNGSTNFFCSWIRWKVAVWTQQRNHYLYPAVCVKVLIVSLTVYATFTDGTSVATNQLLCIAFEFLTMVVMESSAVWDIKPWSSLKVTDVLAARFNNFVYFRPWSWRWIVAAKRRLTFNGPQNVIFQKRQL
jgi:hypothetical protein